ncbi:MAG: TonB-dependent receptor [Candidatus Eisenbacteria bacterium]
MARRFVSVLGGLALVLSAGPRAEAATVSGLVSGADDGEPLSYTDVFLRDHSIGKIANAKGYYVLTGIPAGTHTIVYSHVGYRIEERTVALAEDEELFLAVELAPEAARAEAVRVDASRDLPRVRPGGLSLSTGELNRIPAAIETDLLRGVQMLPGVSALSDFSSGLYVRGGSADQNLILLDDADVYNPNHLFGFFSTFNVDAVKTVDLQKSAYPARFGGRLSSLLDVRNRDGNRKEYEGTVRTSVIASSATFEGPWARGSWMLSGRHTYIEQLAAAMDIDLPYKFYDVHAKLNWDLGRSDRTSLSYYEGLDRLGWDRDGFDLLLDWGNRTASWGWTHLFGTKVFTDFILAYSRFDSRAAVAFEDLEFESKNEIDDVGVKAIATYTPRADHTLDFGIEGKSLRFRFEQGYEDEDDIRFRYDGMYGAAFVQETWRVSALAEIQAGLRIETYSEGDYVDLGPRLTVRRRLSETLSAHAGYGRYNQYLNLVSLEGASFADMWFPVDETLEPGRADHYILGVELGPYPAFDLSVEAYFKPYDNVVEFSEEFTRSLVDSDAKMDDLFNSGEGEAYGLDFYLRNRAAGFEGWIGYSLGWTKRTIGGFNFGEEYYPSYDRRHQLVLMQERPFGKSGKWRLGLAFRYGTGQPTTLAAGRYTVLDPTGREHDTVLEGDLNAYRLPDYHRLDLGLSYRTGWRGLLIEPNVQIINAYNHENVYIRVYDTSKNPAEFEDIAMLPLIPTVGIRVSF